MALSFLVLALVFAFFAFLHFLFDLLSLELKETISFRVSFPTAVEAIYWLLDSVIVAVSPAVVSAIVAVITLVSSPVAVPVAVAVSLILLLLEPWRGY